MRLPFPRTRRSGDTTCPRSRLGQCLVYPSAPRSTYVSPLIEIWMGWRLTGSAVIVWRLPQTGAGRSPENTSTDRSQPPTRRSAARTTTAWSLTFTLFAAIICWDLDRLTRQPRQLEDWIDAAEDRALQLVTANGEADLSTDGGRMYARIKAAVSRAEVERKAARQSRAQVQRAEQGRAPKGTRPLGYATNGSVIEHEAKAVHELYRLFAIQDGPSIAALAAGLSGKTGEHIPKSIPHLPKHTRTLMIERDERRESEGLAPKPVADDGPWGSSTVLGILRNPR